MNKPRTFVIVCDSVGIGAASDAKAFNDEGAHTLKHTAMAKQGIDLPHLNAGGLGNLAPEVPGLSLVSEAQAYHAILEEVSAGKDTMTGHWELMGLHIETPFRTFTDTGFPPALLQAIERFSGRQTLGNIAASGTEIIEQLGEEHLRTGALIVYTSADSVLQIAAHEECVPLEELYRICAYARDLTKHEPYVLGRVIARPFIGAGKGSFKRTANRKDYALKPYGKTLLDELKQSGQEVIALGKIDDIFDGEGITRSIKHATNEEGMLNLMTLAQTSFEGLAFINLVDFDALYGHRRDPLGYHRALESFDAQLGEFLTLVNDEDWVIVTADHGNDPTHHGTDHTREWVPLLIYSKSFKEAKHLGRYRSFATLSQTLATRHGVQASPHGTDLTTLLK
jgi:phosphopentomutase